MDKDTMTIKGTTIEEQALQALTNLAAIVHAGGSSIDKIVKTTVRSHLLSQSLLGSGNNNRALFS